MYRTHKQRPHTAEQIDYQIRRSEVCIARMESEGRTAAADYERTVLARWQAARAALTTAVVA